MAVTQVSKATFQTTLCDQRVMWLDDNAGVTIFPTSTPVGPVTSRLVTVFPSVGAAGSGSRAATATQTVETDFAIARQFPPPDTFAWSGCFSPNVGVLVADPVAVRSPREMTITLDANVYAVGVQVQTQTFGAYTATVVFRNAAAATLLTLVIAGTSTSAGDDSATFFGAKDTAGAIRSIVITSTNDAEGIGINSVDIRVGALVAEGAVLLPGALDCGHPITSTPCVVDEV